MTGCAGVRRRSGVREAEPEGEGARRRDEELSGAAVPAGGEVVPNLAGALQGMKRIGGGCPFADG